jgi:hypothetical protein
VSNRRTGSDDRTYRKVPMIGMVASIVGKQPTKTRRWDKVGSNRLFSLKQPRDTIARGGRPDAHLFFSK